MGPGGEVFSAEGRPQREETSERGRFPCRALYFTFQPCKGILHPQEKGEKSS